MVCVLMLSVIMLNVIMLNVIMLNVIMLSVIMLSVIMLNVKAPKRIFVRTRVGNHKKYLRTSYDDRYFDKSKGSFIKKFWSKLTLFRKLDCFVVV
jgi:hypothetical protein